MRKSGEWTSGPFVLLKGTDLEVSSPEMFAPTEASAYNPRMRSWILFVLAGGVIALVQYNAQHPEAKLLSKGEGSAQTAFTMDDATAPGQPSDAKMRTWTDMNGKKIEAVLEGTKLNRVVLRNGTNVREVPIQYFSRRDKEYLLKQHPSLAVSAANPHYYVPDVSAPPVIDGNGQRNFIAEHEIRRAKARMVAEQNRRDQTLDETCAWEEIPVDVFGRPRPLLPGEKVKTRQRR